MSKICLLLYGYLYYDYHVPVLSGKWLEVQKIISTSSRMLTYCLDFAVILERSLDLSEVLSKVNYHQSKAAHQVFQVANRGPSG